MAVEQLVPPVTRPEHQPRVTLLESGDRLSRTEFERRYEANPLLKKAELVEGVVYVASPVRVQIHGEPTSACETWLGVYAAQTPGTRSAGNSTVRLDADNVVQPDVILRVVTGGSSTVDQDGYVSGPPELVVEVTASTASYDLHDKLRAYRRNGVQEYIAWRVLDSAIDWFSLQNDEYVRLEPDEEGMIESRVFPGLWLDVPAMLSGDLAGVLKKLQEGLASTEHTGLLERLGTAPDSGAAV